MRFLICHGRENFQMKQISVVITSLVEAENISPYRFVTNILLHSCNMGLTSVVNAAFERTAYGLLVW
jgi:hypothetical protein